jgi:hypothetical protein
MEPQIWSLPTEIPKEPVCNNDLIIHNMVFIRTDDVEALWELLW